MVRFSCFNGHIHSHKSKRTVEPSVEAINKTLQDSSQIQVPMASPNTAILDALLLKGQTNTEISGGTKDSRCSMFVEQSCKSEDIRGNLDIENDSRIHQKGLTKCRSLGSALYHEGRVLSDNDTEDEIDHEYSTDSPEQNGFVGPDGINETRVGPSNHQEHALRSESVQGSLNSSNNKSIFLIGYPQHSEKEDFELSGAGGNEIDGHRPRNPPRIPKSSSLPNIGASARSSDGRSYNSIVAKSRSSEDLRVVCMRWKEELLHEVETKTTQEEHERYDDVRKYDRNHLDNSLDDGYDSYNYSASAKDWIIPAADEVTTVKHSPAEPSIQQGDELQGKDFKIKRVQEWVTDLQHCSPLEETNVLSDSIRSPTTDSAVMNGSTAIKMNNIVTPGMEAARRYISSMSATSSTAQLSNHGLAVIPFLGAFVSLKVLNLSGNSIVRITAGSLPRGLHTLNLSKNKISTIEGLRDLTRLRVLDLSYNRVFRIGHGLASCSSLKELYLAGNKISEVEGLHRLLKLTVLDLRFNKISTAKCLGQLAANYNSLQAISLEGNPAQKNVGDEQIKKYLQSLLPHLIYFNRQPIKVSTLKDVADRSVRLGINSHQFDRSLRSDNKAVRKGSHVPSSIKPTSSSTYARKTQDVGSPKTSRGRHVPLPPSGMKPATNERHNYKDTGSKLLNLRSELSMRRSRSEGTLGAF